MTTKTTIGLFQLHVSLIDIVIHDHGDGAYAHYAIELWSKDSNFILLSLARCLCILEKPSVCNYKKLFDEPPLNDYFEELLWGKSKVIISCYYFFEINFLSP